MMLLMARIIYIVIISANNLVKLEKEMLYEDLYRVSIVEVTANNGIAFHIGMCLCMMSK